jgi:hypothetical protein
MRMSEMRARREGGRCIVDLVVDQKFSNGSCGSLDADPGCSTMSDVQEHGYLGQVKNRRIEADWLVSLEKDGWRCFVIRQYELKMRRNKIPGDTSARRK